MSAGISVFLLLWLCIVSIVFLNTFMTLNINAYEIQNVLFVVIISRMLFLL